jgi:serine phosphatase RsbU (regulator of sigma subunit)
MSAVLAGWGRTKGRDVAASRRGVALGLLVVLILMTGALLVTIEVHREYDDERSRKSALVSRAVASLEALDEALSTTSGASALVNDDGQVDPIRWQTYAAALLVQPAVSSLAYAPRVAAAERVAFEADTGLTILELDAQGNPVPAGERAEYFPLALIAPESLAAAAGGFDVSSEPARRTAMTAALERGQPVATEPRLLAGTDVPGVLLFFPLFRPGQANGDPDELTGFFSVAYFIDDLASRVRRELTPGADLTITDGDQLVLGLGENLSGRSDAVVEVVGRDWEVRVRHPNRASLVGAGLIGTGTLLLAVLVGGVGAYLLAQQRRLEEAQRRTSRLQTATATIARGEWPAAVRASAVEHSLGMLPGAAAGLIITSAAHESRIAAIAGDDTHHRYLGVVPHGVTEQAAQSGQPVRYPIGDDEVDEILVIPVARDKAGVSSLVITIPQGARASDADVELCASFAVVVAAGIRRAETHDLEHRMAETLQHHLLTPRTPTFDGLTVAAGYQPALSEASVGGDWYDIIELSPHRVGITVGDVVGHGIQAAGTMGQLRIAVRSLAVTGGGPAAVLEHLDRLAADIPGAECSTAIYLEVDLEQLIMTYSVAGHLPPIIVRDGTAEFLCDGRGTLIGLRRDSSRPEAVHHVEPGDRIIVYTDGLVEQRETGIDESLEQLRQAALATRHLETHDACDALLGQLRARRQRDDAAVTITTINSLTKPATPGL